MTGGANLKIYRGDDQSGEMVDYAVPIAPGMVVLDAVHVPKEFWDESRRTMALKFFNQHVREK